LDVRSLVYWISLEPSPAEEGRPGNPFHGIEVGRDLSRQEEAAGIGFGDPKNILEFPSLSLKLFKCK
jgi:hypothetical protein